MAVSGLRFLMIFPSFILKAIIQLIQQEIGKQGYEARDSNHLQ